MPLFIIRNDITKMKVDAIVNAANTNLQMGGGTCGAIFSAAGARRLQSACDALAPIRVGEAVITKGYALPAKRIIHTAGPIYRDGKDGEEALLRACYKNALNLAKKHRCKSIAFPIISGGAYAYPKEQALTVATGAIGEWLIKNDMEVSLVVYDKAIFAISSGLLGDIRAFIDENYVDEQKKLFGRSQRAFEYEPYFTEESDISISAPLQKSVSEVSVYAQKAAALDKFAERLDEPFSATLLRLIDAKGKSDVEVYKCANLDRKLFSKIRTGKGYMPSKKTAVALAVALELSLSETRDLLERAGFALSSSVMFDVIIEYFISRKIYDVFEINNVLFEYDQQLLGG